MWDFRNRDYLLPSVLTVLARVMLSSTLAYMLLVPMPSAAGVVKGRERSRQQLTREIEKLKEQSRRNEQPVAQRLWAEGPDAVMAQVLARLTVRARQSRLEVAAFRPQRPRVLGSVTELPCTVQISGPYSTVVGFVSSLQNSEAKIALRSVQISASDGNTSAVTATLGLSAYVAGTATPESTGVKGTPRG